MHQYVVSYDITANKARNRVSNYLLRYGHRVQYSVFEIAVRKPVQLEKLQRKIEAELEEGDKIRYYCLCERCRKASQDKLEEGITTFPAVVIV